MRQHDAAGVRPIAVYPEVVSGNPLGLSVVARWALNRPGHLGGDTTFPKNDLIFHYHGVILDGILSDRLDMPLVDRKIFHEGAPENKRNGFCYYAGKYLYFGHKISDEVASNPDGTTLALNIPRKHQEIAEILRSSETYYCYEPSSMVYEALACGCAVAWVDNPYIAQFNLDNNSIRFPKVKESDIGKTKVQKISQAESDKFFTETEKNAWFDIENFINKTQAAANSRAQEITASIKPPSKQAWQMDKHYQEWLEQRAFIATDVEEINRTIDSMGCSAPSFQIVTRLLPGDEHHLADTLDSLSQQIYQLWHVDIVTQLASPPGLEELGFLGWHSICRLDKTKETIDYLAEAQGADWLIEIPAGAKLDPLYLWRCAKQIEDTPNAIAIFVDDDSCNARGERFAPRFKFGVNPTALQSVDLAGVICVSRDAWLATGGASERHGSPWFSKLLKLADKSGWDSIKHIPDILISYPDFFPYDTESCMFALIEDLRGKGIESEITPVTGQSWCIRYPLTQTPSISIVIVSIGQLDLLSRCLTSIIEKTDYQNFEVIIALTNSQGAPDLDAWLANAEQTTKPKVRIVRTNNDGNHATRCNAAVAASSSDFLLFLKEETVVIQEKWLEELIRTAAQPGIGGVSPRMIQPGSTLIENAGSILGLNGIIGSPYQGKTKLREELGYLDCIHVARDVSTLPAACMLIRKESYVNAGGMDETDLGNYLAEADLSLKIRKNGERLIYQPLSNIVSSDAKEAVFDIDPSHLATQMLSETQAKQAFFERWYPEAAVDPFWNPALSLATSTPEPELEFHARWQTIPSDLPRILAHALPNGQGDYRVTSPLNALSKAGMVSECIWRQRTKGEPRFNSINEIVRLNPDSIIVQSYIITPALAALQEWETSGCRPFTVYAQDDLITDMDASNPFRKDIPANARARLQYALKRCDRLVVSTDFLAEAYRNFVPDIRVVPNRLEQAPWLPLRSLRRTCKKPRIGWAGGTTHQGDLLLLKEIIENTRDEADWVFFGMCPEEIRPLIAEYHNLVKFSEYPAYLASLNLDLAVAPLAQTPFNRGKSNLRLLEYGILGIPVVCTDIEPYRNGPAFRVTNMAAEWTDAVRALIHDPEARGREGDAMRRWVLEKYLLENHLEEWLEVHLPS